MGLTEYLFVPGFKIDEFILHQHPLIYFPLLIYVLTRLKSNGKSTYFTIIGVHFLVFFLSYHFFNSDTNPNCAIEACLPLFDWLPPGIYPVAYFIFYTTVALLSLKLFRNQRIQRWIKPLGTKVGFRIYGGFAVILLVKNIWTYQTSPHFSCLPPTEKDGVSIACHYTTEYIPHYFKLIFSVENKSMSGKDCVLNIENESKIEQMYQSVVLRPKRKLALGITIPYPTKDMEVKLSTVCKTIEY